MKPISLLAAVILIVIALVHVVRILMRIQATIGGAIVPFWVSGLAAVALGTVAILLLRENLKG